MYNSDKETFAVYTPLIKAYCGDRERQMVEYDKDFYDKCVSVVPCQKVLDETAFDSRELLGQVLVAEDIEIVKSSVQMLLDAQLARKWSAVQICHAFIKSSILAQVATNFVMQFLIPEALEKAALCDEFLAVNGKLMGPYHGIPISLKEHMYFENKVTCASYVSHLKTDPTAVSGVSIQILAKMGAVFHVRTSQPQCIMHLDTNNNIIGRTRNPLSTKLSPGGSSGGESACVSSYASVIGVGSDIGGSIRCPAAFCNLYGVKTTTKRISLAGGFSGARGFDSIPAVQGPLAKSIEEIDYYLANYINQGKPWELDPLVIPLPYQYNYQLPNTRKLVVGVMFHDGIVTPYPSITRAISHVANKLKQSGRFEVVNVGGMPGNALDMYTMNISLYTSDGNKRHIGLLQESGEPALPLTKHFMEFGGGREMSVLENKDMNFARDCYKAEFYAFMDKLGLDFVLSPVNVAPAELPNNSLYWGYTSLFNLLDVPNVVFPTGLKHDVKLDVLPNDVQLLDNQYEKMVWYNGESIKYNSKDYEGAPIALQLTAKRFEDDKVVAGVRLIDKILAA